MSAVRCEVPPPVRLSAVRNPAGPPAEPGRGERRVAEVHDDCRAALAVLGERISPLFARPEPRAQAIQYALGLLSEDGRRNTWRLAQRVGDSSPWRMQRLLTRARWDAEAVQNAVRGYLTERLGHPDSVLVFEQVDVLKKGSKTVATARQYTEVTRRMENCQAAVMAVYVSPRGSALLDRELYLPPSWAADTERCLRAGVPENRLAYRSKPELARTMIERAMASAVPFRWVGGGRDYGQDEALRGWLEENRVGYVLAVPIGRGPGVLPQRWWSPGGDSGEWTRVALPDRPPFWEPPVSAGEGFTRFLLLHRRAGSSRITGHLVHAPQDTAIRTVAAVARAAEAAQRCLATARRRAGLDRHEIRTWTAWYRHVTLALLASAASTAALDRAS